MKIVVVHKNETRTIAKVEDETTGKHRYYWLDQNGLIENEAEFQKEETKLHPSKEDLQKLFPDATINYGMKRAWNHSLRKMLCVPK